MTTEPRGLVGSFADVSDDVAQVLSDVVYATMTTVDRQGRPRSRILIVVWDLESDPPVGWLPTYKSPVKTAHIAANPHVTTSYWNPRQDALFVDSVARWVADADAETKETVWRMCQQGSPPGVGYEPGDYWRGPDDPNFHVLRLDPWRVQVLRDRDVARGDFTGRIWRAGGRT